jgi:DNA-binding Lrp family transcriptional regulator
MMKKKQGTPRPPQPTTCFIVEGFTEKHYVNVLCEWFDKKYHVYNCEGGNANGVLKKAQAFINDNKQAYDIFIIVYDTDTRHDALEQVEQRENDLRQLPNVALCPLDPCFERCLLSHFQAPKVQGTRCDKVIELIKQNHISNYDKNDFDQLKKYLTIEKIKSMAEKYTCETVQKYFIKTTEQQDNQMNIT